MEFLLILSAFSLLAWSLGEHTTFDDPLDQNSIEEWPRWPPRADSRSNESPVNYQFLLQLGFSNNQNHSSNQNLSSNHSPPAVANLSADESAKIWHYWGIEAAIVSPAQCDKYMASTGCDWTSVARCPQQDTGTTAQQVALNDNSIGYRCCCDVGLWNIEAARKGAATVLEEKAEKCKSASANDPDGNFTRCAWTKEHPCPDQFRSQGYEEDATNLADNFDGYSCCCVLGYWRKNLNYKLIDFTKKIENTKRRPFQLIFVHIPKTAGTTIEEVAIDEGVWYPGKWPQFYPALDMPDGSKCRKYHVPPQYLTALGQSQQDEDVFRVPGTFCVTRDPYERAVSEYLWQLSVEWGPSMSADYRTDLFAEPACTPKGLNRFLKTALLKVREGRKFLHDCHFVPQHEYIFGMDGTQWCHHVFRMDDLPGAFNELMVQHGYKARLGGEEKDNNTTMTCNGEITVADLDSDTTRLIEDVYEGDFTLLEYKKKPQWFTTGRSLSVQKVFDDV